MHPNRRPAVRNSTPSGARWIGLLLLLILPGLVLYRLSTHFDSWLWLIVPIGVNAVCFFVYWADKRRAESGGWRVPESTLHLLELAGGWPAALVAQQTFRHKTAKLSYQFVFWLIVAAHQFLALDCLLSWRLARGLWQFVSG